MSTVPGCPKQARAAARSSQNEGASMNANEPDRGEQLARRRELLVQRSGQLRREVVEQLQVVEPALMWADRLQDAWRWLRANPLAVAGAALTVAVWRPRRSLALALKVWSAWRLLQRARSVGSAASRRLGPAR